MEYEISSSQLINAENLNAEAARRYIAPSLKREDIRKAIYTTNAIESLNSVIGKAIKLFPTDDSAKKVAYLAIIDASKKWTMPIRNWKVALNRFMIEFEQRLTAFV